MHRPRTSRSARAADPHPAVGVALTCALALLSGCAPRASDGPREHSAQATLTLDDATARTRLDALALGETTSPVAGLEAWPALPGVEPAAVAPVSQDDPRARASLDTALASILTTAPDGAGSTPPPPTLASAEDQLAAARAYVRGRQRLLSGATQRGLTDLERAQRADPSSSHLLAALGEAQLASGRRGAALASLRQAQRLGVRSVRVLLPLAREEARVGRTEASLSLLAQAWQADPLRDDAAAPVTSDRFLLQGELAQRLADAGWLSASLDLLERHLRVDPSFLQGSLASVELIEAIRRRPALAVQLGDLHARLGDWESARQAYGAAVAMPGVDPTPAVARLMTALVRLGLPAQAAVTLLEDIELRRGLITPWHVEATAAVASLPQAGPLVPASLAQLSERVLRSTPAVRTGLVRLAARAAPDAQALSLLERTLAPLPRPEESLLADLADRSAVLPPPVRAALLAKTAGWSGGLNAEPLADAVLLAGIEVDALVPALLAQSDVHSRVLASALLRRLGDPHGALRALPDATPDAQPRASGAARMGEGASIVLARMAALRALGDEAQASALIASLTQGPDADPLFASLALDIADRPQEALAALRPLIDGPGPILEDRLLGADFALRAGEYARAAELLEAARSQDPHDPRPHEGLLLLFQPTAPLANDSRLSAAIRELRENAPASDALRLLIARESLARGLLPTARQQLLTLIDDRGTPAAALDALVRTWETTASPSGSSADSVARSEGIALLRERLARRPHSTPWLLALTRVLVASGQATEARALLQDRLRAQPRLESLRRQEEFVVRVGLGDERTADELAAARLLDAPPTGAARTELVEVLVRLGRVDEALEQLRALGSAGTPSDVTAPMRDRLNAAITVSVQRALSSSDPADAALALRALDALAPLGAGLTSGLVVVRARLIALARPGESDAILQAVEAIDDQTEAGARMRGVALGSALSVLLNSSNPSPLVRLIGTLALRPGQPGEPLNEPLMYEWLLRTAAQGSTDDAAWMLARVRDDVPRLRFLADPQPRAVADGAPPLLRAEAAYTLGNFFAIFGREAEATWAYRQALEHDPAHAWASNNLGYTILERGGDISEAARLIEAAHAAKPDEASIADSLGWLRYRQGRIEEAVVELERAQRLLGDRSNPEILMHLGDALWRRNRADDRARAEAVWREAFELASAREDLGDHSEPAPFVRVQNEEQDRARAVKLEGLSARLRAIEQGQPDAPVAPMGIDPVFRPLSRPPILTPMRDDTGMTDEGLPAPDP